MKFCVVIMDGASGWPLKQRNDKTCLELARTPNLDAIACESLMGTTLTVPSGMEPSSACACMSVMGYDPTVYYRGRSGIEARSMGIPVNEGEVVFRCNLVSVIDGIMVSYSAGHISTGEAAAIIETLNQKLGSDLVKFFPGVNYRHICKLTNREDTLNAVCTPPHDITDKPVAQFLPQGQGGSYLKELMQKSESILADHPVNLERKKSGKLPATTIWLFWASGQIPEMPPFQKQYGLKAALTSGVDLLRGLAKMADMEILHIKGVTDGLDNDYEAQVGGALQALEQNDLVILHIEAPDEMGHRGSVDDKVKAIELIDKEVIARIRCWDKDSVKVLVMPDHPTPIQLKTHCGDPVPFLIWDKAALNNGGRRFTEAEAIKTGLFIEPGYKVMGKLLEH
ncbi:MAG: cofactor-independent phosphoglycerate mutase [Dehalococcoidia bacterium]|nr:cofactor-independent phosphoglycerate mutase [Dehalococcoidia bacterium]MDD5493577.1 cofactor-independent phosphoglycerate mutase [Dehalococcoidia bacterium]